MYVPPRSSISGFKDLYRAGQPFKPNENVFARLH
jgi:hypothetical protein